MGRSRDPVAARLTVLTNESLENLARKYTANITVQCVFQGMQCCEYLT